jgi:hypothetical protein
MDTSNVRNTQPLFSMNSTYDTISPKPTTPSQAVHDNVSPPYQPLRDPLRDPRFGSFRIASFDARKESSPLALPRQPCDAVAGPRFVKNVPLQRPHKTYKGLPSATPASPA